MEVDIGFLTKLTGIEPNFFEQYQNQEPVQFSVRDLEFKAK